MISKDDLVKSVAENCGVAPEISNFYFEVFVNRMSSKLTPGDIIQFYNVGFFHKRNCRFQLEKSPDSATSKSYLVQLILFSVEPKIKDDFNAIHFLKIPNLKTLWVDDPDFQHSLSAGDFHPHTDRNQLIKAFATKAEAIIAGLRKNFDSELNEELVIPLTFDLNFLIKSWQKSTPLAAPAAVKIAGESKAGTATEPPSIRKSADTDSKAAADSVAKEKKKELKDDALPWNYRTEFKDDDDAVKVSGKPDSDEDEGISSETEAGAAKDKAPSLDEFEPVTSQLAGKTEEKSPVSKGDTVKFSLGKLIGSEPKKPKSEKKFSEFEPKTDSLYSDEDFKISKEEKKEKSLSRKSKRKVAGKGYHQSNNFLAITVLTAFIVVLGFVIYVYFLRESPYDKKKVFHKVVLSQNSRIIDRDFEFAVTYPYPRTESRIKIEGIDRNAFVTKEVKPQIKKPVQTEKPKETVVKPKEEVKVETTPVVKPEVIPEKTEKKSFRILKRKDYYMVQAGTYKSFDAANAESEKYGRMGYNAVIETEERKGKTSVYKLFIGDFTTEEFAEQFVSKYLK
jgi:cell division septation protein DedD/nucleoid DNA-binding protein